MISQPHFYQADENLWRMFDGITDPMLAPERYETYVLVEPHTGASLSGHARMQVFLNFNTFSDHPGRNIRGCKIFLLVE